MEEGSFESSVGKIVRWNEATCEETFTDLSLRSKIITTIPLLRAASSGEIIVPRVVDRIGWVKTKYSPILIERCY